MDEIYKRFYKGFYSKTGCIPTSPMHLCVYPGDFFQICNGQMIILGNIYKDRVIDVVDDSIKKDIVYSTLNWNFNEGVSKPYSGRGTGTDMLDVEFEFSKQTLAFDSKGSYFFKGNDPRAIKINNWDSIQESLILKLTQVLYSFREVYIVTETTTTSDWTLAIASSKKGKLEIAIDNENPGLVDFFGHGSSKTIRSKDIEFYHHESKRKPTFFKAQKLEVRQEKHSVFMSDLVSKRQSDNLWANSFFDYDLDHSDMATTSQFTNYNHVDLLDLLQANQLNLNNALSYFKWSNADRNDIERFF